WKKIDLGSRLLIEQFDKYQKKHGADTSQTLLDLGCGYGFLSIAAKQLGFNTIDATDNCAAALLSCEENFKQLSINGAVISSDCGDNISKHYDMILCNPPFHHGFDHDTSLTEKFVERSAKLLKKGGKAFFVVNEFVGIEKEANKHFTKQLLLDKNSGFKIIMLSH
ncbi:MAG: methyltransferase, partial [Sinobacterium sp.]|nr:methyltransferase [Sinobacterium sp.]